MTGVYDVIPGIPYIRIQSPKPNCYAITHVYFPETRHFFKAFTTKRMAHLQLPTPIWLLVYRQRMVASSGPEVDVRLQKRAVKLSGFEFRLTAARSSIQVINFF